MPAVKPKVRDDLTVVELDGEAVVYDEETAEMHQLNPTATIVFGMCDGSSTVAEMSTEIAVAFEEPIEVVEPQVRSLVGRFRDAKLLIPGGSASNGGRYVPNRKEGTPGAP